MTDFIFPTSMELREIAQDLMPRLQANRPTFGIFPIEDDDNYLVAWEQEDNYIGLQQVRGLNGDPARVTKTGVKRWQMQPGVYGEFERIDETELTTRRSFGTFGQAVDITDLVMRAQRKLLQRRLDRQETIAWTLLGTGIFSVPGPSGAVVHTDSYTVQTASAAVSWGTPATATPLADFRTVQLKHRGHSVRFDASATAWMNRVTLNKMLSNTNAADLYGRRIAGLATVNSAEEFNQIATRDDLPNIRVYDEGYFDDTNTFVPFIADNKVLVIGKRTDGAPIGSYKMVRNANNPGLAPGAYMRVIDRGETDIPRSIEVHDGHNGGPCILYPSAVVALSV